MHSIFGKNEIKIWKSYIGYMLGNLGEERVTEPDRGSLFDVPLEGQFAERSNVKIYHKQYIKNDIYTVKRYHSIPNVYQTN